MENPKGRRMKSPKTVKALEDLGRVRLSDSFFMRDFMYSEISLPISSLCSLFLLLWLSLKGVSPSLLAKLYREPPLCHLHSGKSIL